MKLNSAKLSSILCLYLLTCHFAQAAPPDAMNATALKELLSGNTIIGQHLNKGFRFDMYLKSDGTFIEKREDQLIPGTWHIDAKGRFCWRRNQKNKTWCHWIIDNGDRTYTNVKKKHGKFKKVRQFKVFDGNVRGLYLPTNR